MSFKKALKRNKIVFRIIKKIYRIFTNRISDKLFVKMQYRMKTKKKLDLENPKRFNEKLQWLKLNWKEDTLITCVDKYAVRGFVKERVGSGILNELYGVYDNVKDIDISELPNSFVLKTTHGSGQNVICKNKNNIDWKNEFRDLKYYMNRNIYDDGREWPYKYVNPKIICEKYLEEEGKSPRDYKFFCFHGVPKIIQLDINRLEDHKRNMYDLNWNLLNVSYARRNYSGSIDPPSRLNDMIKYAEKLSKGFPFVRVDFFQVDNEVFFGEMTFFPENCLGEFIPDSYDFALGEKINLSRLDYSTNCCR